MVVASVCLSVMDVLWLNGARLLLIIIRKSRSLTTSYPSSSWAFCFKTVSSLNLPQLLLIAMILALILWPIL